MTSFDSIFHFQKLESSDESDVESRVEINTKEKNNITNPCYRNNQTETIHLLSDSNDASSSIIEMKPSPRKLEIMENRKNLKKKFSIWSEILMEEELNESMDNFLKLKRRKKKFELDSEKEVKTKEDFERKFAVKKKNSLKKKTKINELQKDLVNQIARQLKEPRIDIIREYLFCFV